MKCKHDMDNLPFHGQLHCRECGMSAREIQLEKECQRLRVCGNCRHFSTGYTEDLCAKPSRYGETTRQSTCDGWEMI
jgi:hypothetical protein